MFDKVLMKTWQRVDEYKEGRSKLHPVDEEAGQGGMQEANCG